MPTASVAGVVSEPVSGAPAARRPASDPLAPLLALPGVQEAVTAAQSAADAVQWHRALRRRADQVLRELALEEAVATASLWDAARSTADDGGAGGADGGRQGQLDPGADGLLDADGVRARLRTGEPLPPRVQAAFRVGEEVATAAGSGPGWAVAPRQVLGRLHLAAAAGSLPDEQLGRPRQDAEVVSRLDLLLETAAASAAPAVVVAAVVQGELLALDAFPGDGGLVARAASAVVLRARGADPRGVVPLSTGHLDLGAAAYSAALAAFITGTAEGVAQWLRYFANVVVIASRRGDEIASAVV